MVKKSITSFGVSKENIKIFECCDSDTHRARAKLLVKSEMSRDPEIDASKL